ncbi:hypothetical protein OsI_28117 [Oryza sativa Indica Group]|uniref:Uncharacterized protein n=1 Tax=Oryza sativa subsp. indica TaxID=39946 RepID=A2YS19_ORYSI|nr:hypothetical protein OsI_28117 [Oryza sativa Indica Group]
MEAAAAIGGARSPLSFSSSLCNAKVSSGLAVHNVKIKSTRRLEVVCHGMLTTRQVHAEEEERGGKICSDVGTLAVMCRCSLPGCLAVKRALTT